MDSQPWLCTGPTIIAGVTGNYLHARFASRYTDPPRCRMSFVILPVQGPIVAYRLFEIDSTNWMYGYAQALLRE